jgi:hypothetical protein
MKTVAECSSADEALVLQSLLADCGVQAFLPDALAVSYPPTMGSLRVQVADEDGEAAAAILADKGK